MKIIDANCSNCEYVRYIHVDFIRLERCGIKVDKKNYNQFPSNPDAMEAVLNGKESLCEKHIEAKNLTDQGIIVVY